MIRKTYGATLTIVVGNHKGGVGKSTVANLLASGLALAGASVLLVDTDTQGHAATLLGLPKDDALYHALTGRARFEDAARPVPVERYAPAGQAAGPLWLVSSGLLTQRITLEVDDVWALRRLIAHVGAACDVDYCIVDTPPTATLLESAIYYAADAVLLVTEPAALAVDGLRESWGVIQAVSDVRAEDDLPALELLGVLVNKVQGRPSIQQAYMATLATKSGMPLLATCLPLRTLWQHAAAHRQSIYSYAPTSAEAELSAAVVDELQERIATWLQHATR